MDKRECKFETPPPRSPPPSSPPLNKASRYTIFDITGKEVSQVAPCVAIIIIAFTDLDPCVKRVFTC